MLSFKVHRVWDGVHTARQTNDPKPIFYDKTQKKRVKLRDPHSNIDCKFQPKAHVSMIRKQSTCHFYDHDLCGFLLWSHSARESVCWSEYLANIHTNRKPGKICIYLPKLNSRYHISCWRKKSEWGGHVIMWKKAQKKWEIGEQIMAKWNMRKNIQQIVLTVTKDTLVVNMESSVSVVGLLLVGRRVESRVMSKKWEVRADRHHRALASTDQIRRKEHFSPIESPLSFFIPFQHS